LRAGLGDVASGVFNVGSGSALTLNQLFMLIAGEDGVRPTYAPARAGDIRHSTSDITRATRQLGYRPSVAVGDGLRALLQHVRHELRAGER
jgi:nucleoside-diphosphate-sugar epimerase